MAKVEGVKKRIHTQLWPDSELLSDVGIRFAHEHQLPEIGKPIRQCNITIVQGKQSFLTYFLYVGRMAWMLGQFDRQNNWNFPQQIDSW